MITPDRYVEKDPRWLLFQGGSTARLPERMTSPSARGWRSWRRLIFWLYLVGMAVLLGGEINAEAEHEAAAQAGRPQAQASAQQLNTTA